MEIILRLQQLLNLIGNVTLSEAVTWLEVEENAERLRKEGHEEDGE
jgi:hypothetical protein